MELYSINNLKSMEVIDINTGSKLGFIRDLKVDCENYRIISLIIPTEKSSWFDKNDYMEVMWDEIIRIGIDVILVSKRELSLDNK
ncbi:YlmC/YmxH family sporulation protein [Clostridium aestuarii]|uniref:YlmC/YmxH family sporulation protein n=1 Tax=Clostridium aestuarii TaxID=338193 RepID=A0ABT4D081_9CLOT|nr:YlmC/YmxH family sporulation protein [Clostridium aestuarii]MCY6484027.1 YlmC/YmxH family sporulation protein [Clostridium aestuarii]